MTNFKKWFQLNEGIIPGQGGWKIHLRTGTDDKKRDRAYEIVLDIIKNNGGKWLSKKLHGGEADEKDITIYCGIKSEANKAALAIAKNSELSGLLLPPGKEMLQDDVEILPNTNVYGRFEASRLNTGEHEFHQYGCKGHSMLKSYVSASLWDKKNFDREKACRVSRIVLEKLFGTDFTG